MHHHSNHKFATITDLGLKNSINELKIIKTESIISHLNKVDIANLFSVEEAKLRTISIKTQASKEMHSSISNDLVEIQNKIKNIELIFSQGAYFEAILQYNNISEEFLKIGHLESALLYKKIANNVLEISKKRDQLVLEFEESFSKLNYQVKKIEDLKTFFKLELIIDLSQKINDRETVKEFEDIFISLNEDELH